MLALGFGVRKLVDDGFASGDAALLDGAVMVLFGVILLLAVASYARFYLVSWIGERVVADIRRAVYERVISLSPAYYEVTRTGEILSRLTTDTTLLQVVVGSSVSIALRNTLLLVGGTVLLIITSPKLTGLVFLVVPFVLLPILIYGRKVRRLSRESQDRVADVGAYVDESLNAIRTVQAFGHEDRAVDDRLDRPLALKVLTEELASDDQAMKRFGREARAASALNHPNICTIYDVGEFRDAEGKQRAFLAMEFMEGRTLKATLQETLLTPERVLDLALQICDGLGAAHDVGIIHRDLKPANLFVTKHGHAKILDFGLAKVAGDGHHESSAVTSLPTQTSPEPLTKHGTTLGTAAYMSPEQARGEALDIRSDIFSLGVVLYEMATGTHPFAGETMAITHDALLNREPEDPARRRTIPGALGAAILRCLEKDPALRYQSVAGLRGDLVRCQRDSTGSNAVGASSPIENPNQSASRRTVWAAAATALVAFVSYSVWSNMSGDRATGTPDERVAGTSTNEPSRATSSVVLAGIENRTADPAFDRTLDTALGVKIDESPFLQAVSSPRLQGVLREMRAAPGGELDEETVFEACRRLGAAAVIRGNIATLDQHFVVTLEGLACGTRESLTRTQEEALNRNEVLSALGKATTTVRVALGETLESVTAHNVPIERATTRSLEALESYSLGIEVSKTVGDLAAMPHIERALELDAGFAMAYRKLAIIHDNYLSLDRAAELATLAYESREGVTAAEGLAIEAAFHSIVEGDIPRQLAAHDLAVKRGLDQSTVGLTNMGWALEQMGQLEKAIDHYQRALDQTPDDLRTITNLARVLIHAGQRDAAYNQIAKVEEDHIYLHQFSLWVAYLEDDRAAFVAQANRLNELPWTDFWHGEALASWGQLREARAFWERSIDSAARQGLTGMGDSQRAFMSFILAELGLPDEAAKHARAALSSTRNLETLHWGAMTLARAGHLDEATDLATELSAIQPKGTLNQSVRVPQVRAAIALGRRQPLEALEALHLAQPFDRAWYYSILERGRAHRAAGNLEPAIQEFETGRTLRGAWPVEPMHTILILELARTQAEIGQIEKALRSYEELLHVWRDADPEFALVRGGTSRAPGSGRS